MTSLQDDLVEVVAREMWNATHDPVYFKPGLNLNSWEGALQAERETAKKAAKAAIEAYENWQAGSGGLK